MAQLQIKPSELERCPFIAGPVVTRCLLGWLAENGWVVVRTETVYKSVEQPEPPTNKADNFYGITGTRGVYA